MGEKFNYAFLHGGGQGSWVWDETVAALKLQSGQELGKILALDVPGCGTKRHRDTVDISFSEIVEELLEDLEAAQLENIILVGHSQAGTVIPAIAARKPTLFRRLIYVTCSIPLPGQNIIDMIGDSVHGSVETEVGWPVDPQTTSIRQRTEIMLCNDMSRSDAKGFMERLGGDQWPGSSYVETNWEPASPGNIPSTYVLCLQDNILPVPWQKTFAERFGAAKLIRIDAGHQVQNTRPHGLAEILRLECRP